MASQLTAAVFEAAAKAVAMKSDSVSIPNAYCRGSDADIILDAAKLQHSFKSPHASSAGGSVHHYRKPGFGVDHLGGINVTEAKASDQGTKPMFQLLAEVSSSITPALIAKHYLPGILLQHGPLAIRYITAHLISTLPGFSTIPPAKQRRLVVGALEGRGGCSGVMGEVGGVDGDVIFEKVGWGRWDARKKGDPPRTTTPISPPLSATRFERDDALPGYAGDAPDVRQSNSYRESGIFVQSEEEDPHDVDMEDVMLEDENSSSETSEDDDMTDEEDWAQMGAAALRRHGVSPITSDGWGNSYTRSPASGFVQWPKGMGMSESPQQKRAREEREAVEALVKLSSV
jgi:hypothetical protein